MRMTYPLASAAGAFCTLLLAACDAPTPPAVEARPPTSQQEVRQQPDDLRQRQLAFLNRLRDADPSAKTIDRAMLNEQNELGLILDRSVDMAQIQPLMKTMLAQMAREFPDQDITVLAYAPSEPPRKIGTARLDAQTRDMTYTAAQ